MTQFLSLLEGAELWSLLVGVLDVAIVALIIYRVLLLIRGTRAAYMLVGMLAVAGLFVAAQRLSLGTVQWLLDNVLNYLLLIVIIVFQADIRRGLMRMGRRMFEPTQGDEDLAALEEIVQACEAMARNHTGALIVLEREVELDELVQSGTVVDARLSSDLLLSIFTAGPDNPLHDGAALVRGHRLHKAAVLLPLTANPSIDRTLGTRHRAAIGITEEADVLAVVVSEQRGAISLCSGGLIQTGLSAPALRRELLARLSSKTSRRGVLWPWIAHAVETLLLGDRQRRRATSRSADEAAGARGPTGPHAPAARPGAKAEPRGPAAEERR